MYLSIFKLIQIIAQSRNSSEVKPLSRKGEKLLEAYLSQAKRVFERPLEFLHSHFLKLKESVKESHESFLKRVENFEKQCLCQNEFTDEFKQQISQSIQSIQEKIEQNRGKRKEEEEVEEDSNVKEELEGVFDYDEERSDFSEIREMIYAAIFQIEKCLFLNKTFLFMHEEMIKVFTQSWCDRIKTFKPPTQKHRLIVVKNEYVALNPFILLLRYTSKFKKVAFKTNKNNA